MQKQVICQLLSVCCLASIILNAQERLAEGVGVVTGTVQDAGGKPLPNCTVTLWDARPFGRNVRQGSTDKAGQFTIKIAFSTYYVGTSCEWAGFPDTTSALYGTASESVTVGTGSPAAHVTIVRKDKAGRISRVNVLDAATGKRVLETDPTTGGTRDAASIEIHRADDPIRTLTTRVYASNIFVPAGVPVVVTIQAPGYSAWHYGGAGDLEHAKPLVVQAGQEITIDVMLQPAGR